MPSLKWLRLGGYCGHLPQYECGTGAGICNGSPTGVGPRWYPWAMVRVVMATLVCMGGCGIDLPKPDPRPIEEALGTAMPLAFAGSIAISALSGESNPCVTLQTPCLSPPCTGALTIDAEECPLPLFAGSKGRSLWREPGAMTIPLCWVLPLAT